MKDQISVVYFSPTGGVKAAALALGSKLADKINEIEVSKQQDSQSFGPDHLVLFAAPVFGGRIPSYMLNKLKSYTGSHTKAITVGVYGNRAFEDALLELNDALEAQGFEIVASAALIAEHSMVRAVAAGRPDEEDKAEIAQFAQAILAKLEQNTAAFATPVPGNRPYRDWTPMPVVPLTSDDCIVCGVCVSKCPTKAIEERDPAATDPAKCMLCMRCIAICPQKAKSLPAPVEAMLNQKLSPLAGIRNKNQLFL